MKHSLFLIVLAGVLLSLVPQTSQAGFYVSIRDDCDCCWGVPDPWDPWWECPYYWDIWVWCSYHPYWMWPWWCRQWVNYHYSSCGRYYYVYYDYYVPRSHRVYIDGRYRYRYEVELDRSYNVTERIPRRRGLERPMPEPVERNISNLGPEYRIKTVSTHAEVEQSLRDRPSESISRRGEETVGSASGVEYRSSSNTIDMNESSKDDREIYYPSSSRESDESAYEDRNSASRSSNKIEYAPKSSENDSESPNDYGNSSSRKSSSSVSNTNTNSSSSRSKSSSSSSTSNRSSSSSSSLRSK